MAIVRKTIDFSTKLTDEQLRMLEEAEKAPHVYDEENPPLTREELAQFRRVSDLIKEERESSRKQNVTLRLSPKTIRKAKSLGKGYTSILARIVERVLDNPELAGLLINP